MARLWKGTRLGLLGLATVFFVGADSPSGAATVVTAEQANAETVVALTGGTHIVGWTLRSETLVLGLTQVRDANGKVVYETTLAENAYVLWYTAPAQHGCTYIYANAETNADPGGTGGGGWGVSCSNDPNYAYPGPGPNSTQSRP